MYADDLLLIMTSILNVQYMLNVRVSKTNKLGYRFFHMLRDVLILLQLRNVNLIVGGKILIGKYVDIINGSQSGS